MLNSASLLSVVPASLREQLISCYQQIVRNYIEQRWEPSELNGGKLCEIVYTIVEGALSGSFATQAKKPDRLVDACRALEGRPADVNRVGDRSLRVLIPRLLPFLYEIRNNRGVGHVGGDVDPNHEDAEAVLACANWLMAELVRIFHGVSLVEAQMAVEKLVQRRHHLVWSASSGTKRILDPRMKASDQTLVLLYSESGWTLLADLKNWIEYRSVSGFKTRVIVPLHGQRLVEYQHAQDQVRISPLGIRAVEERLLKV